MPTASLVKKNQNVVVVDATNPISKNKKGVGF